MDPLELSARFGLAPNSLDYCGKRSFSKAFSAYIQNRNGSNRKRLESELKKFKAHYAYLSLIARSNSLSPLSPGVSEALWIGNGLLRRVKKRDLQKLIRADFSGPGFLSEKRAHAISSQLPDGAVPHHSFHPLIIGSITGVITRSIPNADKCRISWGKVISISGKSAMLKSQSLTRKNGKLTLVPSIRGAKLSCAGITLIQSPKIGDMLATHWDFAVMKISKAQAISLSKYTKLNILAANRMGIGLK